MKHFIFSFIFAFIAIVGYGQPGFNRFRPHIDINKYEVIDSLPVERIMIHFDKEVDDENLIDLGSGYYMAKVPHNDNMIIRTTVDKTKAIVVYNSYAWGRHFEFNIKDNEHRMVLWYDSKGIYCGYIYDKKYKVVKYFESKKEFKRFIKRPFFRNINN